VTNGQVVALDALVWAAWSVVVGYAAHRLPLGLLDHDGPLTRLRSWERGGRAYERLGIRRWKDRLPEFGAVFRGGTSKRSLPSRDTPALVRFTAETRRAELVHWAIPLLAPVFAVWNPAWLFGAMVGYAVLANAPCLIVQRYNRGRLQRILARRARTGRQHRPGAEPPGRRGARA
jgi:glycosyl-4,4'-diaponeurosporenoate acyltransferase